MENLTGTHGNIRTRRLLQIFAEKLSEIPEGQTIELHINSNGGSVKEGVAIYNLLKQKQNQKVRD